MTNNNNWTYIGFCDLLFLLFLGLKLTNVIAWSWWFVTMPLWAPVLVVLFLVFVMWFIITMIDR